MSNFLKIVLGSCLGVVLAFIAVMVLGGITLAGIANSIGQSTTSIKNNSVLVFKPAEIPELTNNTAFAGFELDAEEVPGLQDILESLREAAKDDQIKGIMLDLDQASLMPATALALRQELLSFRESGKFIVAHSKAYTQNAYYLASVADGLYLNPTGYLDLRGFGSTIPFFTGAFEKLGIDVSVIYAGDFKSAGEPFFRKSISDSNRLQTREYLEDLWTIYTNDVATSRGIEPEKLRLMAENWQIDTDSTALRENLVDGLIYRDEVLDDVRRRIGLNIDENEDIPSVSLVDYVKAKGKSPYKGSNRIAVVYAEGNIMDGEGEPGTITDGEYARLIRELRHKDDIDAIVLRVNSGGGSAMASENIFRELKLAKEQGIPVVTSMGGVAASGGYYIAMASDSIFAEPNTITGSIGVVAILPNVSRFMGEKLGITFDTVNTGRYSNALTPVIPYSEKDRAFLQERITEIYELFLTRVAEGRNMPIARIRELAKGRVYTGQDAKELGLVDAMGGLDRAIAAAATLAGVEGDFKVSNYPRRKNPQEQLIEELLNQGKDDQIKAEWLEAELSSRFGKTVADWMKWQRLHADGRPQALMLETLSF